MKIVVFGAGGRIGRQVLSEAQSRGHEVAAVVRNPARLGYLNGIRVLEGDVLDEASVEQASAGYDAAVAAAVDVSLPPHEFFTASARALTTGLAKAGVERLVTVGLASVLPGSSGALLMDEPGYPNDYRSFYLGHAAGLDELRASDRDWTYMAPAGDFDHEGVRTGRYRIADHGDSTSRVTPADFAIALVDEVEVPRHMRVAVSVQEA